MRRPVAHSLAAWLICCFALPDVSSQTSVGSEPSAACFPSTSRARAGCEPSKVVVRTETELDVTLELPPVTTAQCAATIELEYSQRDTVARVEGTLDHDVCAASAGELRLDIRVRGENGELRTIEFVESWQRVDDEPVRFSGEYPIGDDVDLVAVRSRQLRCTCSDATAAAE